ncbi:hypothetical protein JCM10212_003724 [Sporobolomyces blumeae]
MEEFIENAQVKVTDRHWEEEEGIDVEAEAEWLPEEMADPAHRETVDENPEYDLVAHAEQVRIKEQNIAANEARIAQAHPDRAKKAENREQAIVHAETAEKRRKRVERIQRNQAKPNYEEERQARIKETRYKKGLRRKEKKKREREEKKREREGQ